MSYSTLTRQVYDAAFQSRVTAAAMKEAWHNQELGASEFGQALRQGQVTPQQVFMWPVSIDNETAYEYAVAADNPDPGGDAGVVTDGAILAGVQQYWPATWPPPAPPAPPASP